MYLRVVLAHGLHPVEGLGARSSDNVHSAFGEPPNSGAFVGSHQSSMESAKIYRKVRYDHSNNYIYFTAALKGRIKVTLGKNWTLSLKETNYAEFTTETVRSLNTHGIKLQKQQR